MKTTVVIGLMFVFVATFSAFTKSSDPRFKNLKILPQDISHEQMDSVMKHFAVSLGVRCNYCHARTEDQAHLDFASDAKGEKNIARKMMTMTNTIILNNFNMEGVEHTNPMVTCYTCHRGQEQPDAMIPDSLLQKRH